MEHLLVIALVIMPGVWSGNWKVTLNDQCALRGSSVVIQCSYDYPDGQTVNYVQWYKQIWGSNDQVLKPSDGFVFDGDLAHNCNLRIWDVRYTDEGRYYFRFKTNRDRWTSETAYLHVEALVLTVEPIIVKEGEHVKLTCHSGCRTQRNLQFVWFRNGQRVSQPSFIASRENTGRYHCALEGLNVQSLSVVLNVQYAPEKVMLTMSTSKDLVQGDVVVFSCNCESVPPVADSGYSLFKDGQFISFGREHTISVQPSDSGQYHCQASNNITTEGNSLFNSSTRTLSVQYRPMNTSISVISTEVTEGSDVNLTCNSNANPPATEYTWYKRGSSSSPSSMVLVGSGSVLSLSSVQPSHTGHYMCHVRNKHGENNSTELLLSIKTKDTVTSVPILAGIGASLFAALVLALLLYWMKRKRPQNIRQTTVIRKRRSTSVVNDETDDHVYVNAHDLKPPSTTQDEVKQTFFEDVTYSVVTIKTKSPPDQIQTRASQTDDVVIYATVTKPR